MAKNKIRRTRGGKPVSRRDGRRVEPRASTSVESSGSGGGLMSSMRSGIKNVAGSGGEQKKLKTTTQKFWNILFWLVIVALVMSFAYSRLRR